MPRLFFALFAGLLLAGCDASDPLGSDSSLNDRDAERGLPSLDRAALHPALLPLAVGRAWVFERAHIRLDGTVSSTGLDTLRVASDTLIAGETWYFLDAPGFQARTCLTGYYTTRDGDVWHWPDTSDGAPYRQYLYPALPGATYPYEQPEAVATATVEATDAPLEVPAGQFSTYWYDVDYDAVAGYAVTEDTPPTPRYLTPGVGFVRFESAYYTLTGGNGDAFTLHSTLRWDLAEVIEP
jgi:hypothetical protein